VQLKESEATAGVLDMVEAAIYKKDEEVEAAGKRKKHLDQI
jgi:hypothetical protein